MTKLSLLLMLVLLGCTKSGSGSIVSSSSEPHAKVLVTTSAPINSNDNYVTGSFAIDSSGLDGSWDLSSTMSIKGTDDVTWDFPKKPYKMELDTPASVMDLPADKDWLLLAHYSDKTFIRTELAMELGRRLGMPYVPRTKQVNLSLNGKDQGAYLLIEQIKVSADRVNAVATDVTGGYLVEIDEKRNDPYVFETAKGIPYTIRAPVAPTTTEATYIETYIQNTEGALFAVNFAGPSGYANYIDVDSFIDWYLVNEILKNTGVDSSYTYFYKSSGEKLKMGPPWNFDFSVGNIEYNDAKDPTGWWTRNKSPWFARLFQDPAFVLKVKARYKQLKSLNADYDSLAVFIDQKQRSLTQTAVDNYSIWNILGTYVWPNRVVTGSYPNEVYAMKIWLKSRMQWMDSQFK